MLESRFSLSPPVNRGAYIESRGDFRHCLYAEEEDQSFRTFPTSDLFFLSYFWAACMQKRSQKSSDLKISDLVKWRPQRQHLEVKYYPAAHGSLASVPAPLLSAARPGTTRELITSCATPSTRDIV